MKLLPQDVMVAIKLAVHRAECTYAQLAADLELSASQVHDAVKRASAAGLLSRNTLRPLVPNLREFIVHGVRYAFPAQLGRIVRGVPTAYSAPCMSDMFDSNEQPAVWPDPNGRMRGAMVEPLHRSAVAASLRDPDLYAGLALVDAFRVGQARERKVAEDKLGELLRRAAKQ